MEGVSEVEVQKDKCRKESKRTRVEVEMQNAEIEKIETWISTSGKVVLMGDAAHAMVPYMAQVRFLPLTN